MEDGKPYNKDFAASFQYLKNMLIIMSFGRLAMVLVSLKWHGLTKYFLYYEIIFYIARQSMPQDYGKVHATLVYLEIFLYYIVFSFNYLRSSLALAVTQLYIGLFLRKYLYEDKLDSEHVISTLGYLVMQQFLLGVAYMTITYFGYVFVFAELPRLGNEKLLNGLKEGVFIIEEDSSIIKF